MAAYVVETEHSMRAVTSTIGANHSSNAWPTNDDPGGPPATTT